MRHHGGQAGGHALPTARFHERQDRERREAEHDQKKLEDLIVDRAGQSTERSVGEHDGGGEQHGTGKAPAEHQLKQQSEGIHRDARRENRHHREGDGIEAARFFVEAQLEVFRH
jgi:hypothetical protein